MVEKPLTTRAGQKSIPIVYWVVLIILIAAGLRVFGVYRISPPGLEHDEVANWLIDRSILEGNHAIYFPAAYGHEAGFHYIQALFVALIGDHALSLRLPAIFAGLLLVAIHFALVHRLFGFPIAITSTAFLAVLFWAVFYSRLGLRAMLLPVVSGVSLYCWMQGLGIRRSAGAKGSVAVGSHLHKSRYYLVLAGLLAALTLYTYMAARAVPIFYLLFVIYLMIAQRDLFLKNWREILLFALTFLIVAIPLVLFLRANPTAEFRLSEIDAPLQALRTGELRPVLQNSLRILAMFGFAGDPLWRQNVAGRPVFGPVMALFFYAGIFMSLWRWREPRHAFLLLWLAAAAIPSLVTVDAPSTIRMINALLVITVFPALIIHNLPRFSTVAPKLSTKTAYLLAVLLIVPHIWWTIAGVFHRWPANEEVRFVWQAALTDTAAFLDEVTAPYPTAIGGWSPATMDPPTMFLSMRRRDMDLRHFGSDSMTEPVRTLIVPHEQGAERAWITRPAIRDLAAELETQLLQWGASVLPEGSFVLYEIPIPVPVEAQVSVSRTFGDELQLLGYTIPEGDCQEESCHLLTFWRVLGPPQRSLRFYLHAVDDEGVLVAQDDALDAPSQFWRAGDNLVQLHVLNSGAKEFADLRLGVYEPDTGQRLLLPDGADSFNFALP